MVRCLFAQLLLVDQYRRILRWMLKPEQNIKEHQVSDSPFYVVIIKGRGMFAEVDGHEQEFNSSSLLIFEPGEPYTVRNLDEELIFISFLQAADTMRIDRIGGEIGYE